MSQENKNTTGAPAGDTTSALFVSARKKQLEQQESDRRAKEKEDQRLAAEAEVRRLEREVEERRRKAEENARRAEADAAAETRRIAEEAKARQTQAAANPDAVLGAQPQKKEIKMPSMPKSSSASPATSPAASGGAAAAKAPLNTKMLAIIGGVAGVIILIVVLVFALGRGNDSGGGSTAPTSYSVSGGYYLNGDAEGLNIHFSDSGSAEVYLGDSLLYNGHCEVTGSRLVLTIASIGDEMHFTIIDGDTIMDNDGDSYYRKGSAEGAQTAPAPSFTLDGGYYLGGDKNMLNIYFYNDGTVVLYQGGASQGEGHYSINGSRLNVTVPGVYDYAFDIIDEETIVDSDGDYFFKID